MLFDGMAERITGLTLTKGGEPVFFMGASFNAFNFGFEMYDGLFRLNLAMLMIIVRW